MGTARVQLRPKYLSKAEEALWHTIRSMISFAPGQREPV